MSRRNKGGGGGHGGGGEERWLLPYADMITLLLGLFIVLFAMSSVDTSKFDNVRRSLAQTFKGAVLEESGGVLEGSSGIMDPENANQSTDNRIVRELEIASNATNARFDKEREKLQRVIEQAGLAKDVEVTRNERGIVVRMAGDALFASGSSVLRPALHDKLERLAIELKAFGSPIEISGHTDSQPYDGRFGNLGLSTDRANEVYMLFDRNGFPTGKMRSVGMADTAPIDKPTGPNQSIAKNRRIEITILEPGADDPLDKRLVHAGASGAMKSSKSTAVAPTSTRPSSSSDSAKARAAVRGEVNEGIVEDLAATSKAVG